MRLKGHLGFVDGVGRVVGPWLGVRIGHNGPDYTQNYLLFDVHAQHFTTADASFNGFGAGLIVVIRLRGRTLVRFGRNWGEAYR